MRSPLRLLRGEPPGALSRELGVEVYRLERWRDRALKGPGRRAQGARGVTPSRPSSTPPCAAAASSPWRPAAACEDRASAPFGRPEIEALSAAISISTGASYGVKRVCAAWGVAPSTFYAAPAAAAPARSDARGLGRGALRDDRRRPRRLALLRRGTPQGPRAPQGRRRARRRVARVRVRASATTAGSPATRPTSCGAATVRECSPPRRACAFVFADAGHFNGQVVGRHVCKRGDRCAALQPASQGLLAHFDAITADVGRGLSLRMDHGT